MTYSIEFEIPGLPPMNMNGRGHWRKRHEESKRWKTRAYVMALDAGRPPKPLARARVEMVRLSTTEPDYDNLAQSFKPLIDGLVRAGIITDDKPSVIGRPEYGWEKTKRGHGGVRVRVEATE